MPFCSSLLAVVDDHNPIGVTGVFEGVTTTAGAYNVLNHNATRQIDDIVVPGAIGKYGLKMTRYYNSRSQAYFNLMGPGWSHEYMWLNGSDKVAYPNGTVWDTHCTGDWGMGGPLAVSDWLTTWSGYPNFRLADGGSVLFSGVLINGTYYYSLPTYIFDPYGQMTTLTYDASGLLYRVIEPGGRYLQFSYTLRPAPYGQYTLTRVEAHGFGNSTVTDWVNYTYALQQTGGNIVQQGWCITTVTYSDGQQASYTYTTDNQPDHPTGQCPCTQKLLPLVKTCKDVRYKGPMRQICYDYQDQGPHGAITAERYSLNGSTNGVQVSKITPSEPSPLGVGATFPTTYTETRADGPTRTFNYTALSITRSSGGDPDPCPGVNGWPPQQFLQSYTDFQNHTTYLGYDPTTWYLTSVQDANSHTTTYQRGPPPNAYPGPKGIGQITQIKHPDGKHIDYTYDDESPDISGHYLHSITDERGAYVGDPAHTTTYTRDTAHRVTRIDYPADANTPASYEEFTLYNNFGQVLTHHLRNGAWESFLYDPRGLLTDKYNPKSTGIPGGSDPHTHYSYYTAGPWTDRVQTITLPPNFAYGLQATETYEYDRALGADGTTDPNGAQVAGRGLITKITHGDTPTDTYQSFGYDAYGNKRWEENELRQRTSYTYDDYNRMLTDKNPLLKTINYTYNPTNGGGSSYTHTTNNPDTVTSPGGIVTSNVYDQNFRKTSTSVAGSTTLFHYDPVGNQDYVTDPRSYTTYTDYDTRNRKWQVREPLSRTTQFYYDDNINITRIVRPDTTTETKTYDAMNRVLTDTVPKTSNPLVNLITSFTYNPSGTIQKITDPNGYNTWLYYDASDRRVTMTYGDSISTQHWDYDDAGNLKSRTAVDGTTKNFSYDKRNRLNATTWSNWDDTTRNPDWCYFGHDAAGRLTEAENGTSGWGANIICDVHRSYDAAGHLTLDQQIVTGLGTYNVNYPSYDDDGRLTRMSSVSGYDFTYSYDLMGRFEKIFITNGAQLFQYQYDASSNETERDNVTANGVSQVYPRDALNRMQYMDVKKGTTILAHEGYTYDLMNRITAVAYPTPQPADSFGYYLDGELNTATLGNLGHSLTYNLDKMGNRTSVVDNNVPSTYSPNTINQYTTAAGGSVAIGSEHEIQSYNGVNYTYINDERLASAAISGQSPGGTTYSMVYDALGRCVKRSLSGGPATYYIYDGEKPILEYDSGGTLVGTNLYGKGIDEILERVAAGSVYFPQQNHEGSVTLLTDPSGNVLERYRYDAFGAPTIYDQNWNVRSNTMYDNRFLFTGREYAATYRSITNAAFNFYEYRARAYNPKLGRFMSEDPKGFDAGDYNLFRYCHNDPIDLSDPIGTDPPVAYSAQEMSKLREQIQEGLRQAAQQRAYARAYSRGNFEGGTSFIGMANFHMGQVGVQSQTMHTYSLKSQYKIGDLSGARGYQYVWDSNDKCSGQCLTGVQHLTGAPNSSTPLIQGAAVDANTLQGMAIARGWVLRNGQYVYPSKPAGQSDNHSAVFVASTGKGYAEILSQYNISPTNRAPLHLEVVPTSGWHVIASPLPARTASGSELRAWDGSIPW